MRKICLAQETPTPGPIPPIEDIFACMTPRITGKEPLPRVSCMIGSEEGTTEETPFRIECIAPRFACMLGLRETAGSLSLGGMMEKAKNLPTIKELGNKLGLGIPLGNHAKQQQQPSQRQRPPLAQKHTQPGVGSELVIRA